jgi:hypothetical protein
MLRIWYCNSCRTLRILVVLGPDLCVVGSALSYFGLPEYINGPISCGSWMIGCVCASVFEVEIAGDFQCAQTAAHHRRIVHDLGYPQPPTLPRMDNSVAIGLASGKMNAKRSKSIDMRFFWLVDRVEQG